MQSQNKRRLVLIIAILVAFIGLALVFFSSRGSRQEYKDDPSGEIVSDPSDRQGESYGTDQNSIAFYGTRELIDAGLSSFAVDTFREQLREYSYKKGDYIKSASIYADRIKRERGGEKDIASFQVSINRDQDIFVEIEFVSLTKIRITATSKEGSVLFSTKVIDQFKSEEEENFTGDGTPPEESSR